VNGLEARQIKSLSGNEGRMKQHLGMEARNHTQRTRKPAKFEHSGRRSRGNTQGGRGKHKVVVARFGDGMTTKTTKLGGGKAAALKVTNRLR